MIPLAHDFTNERVVIAGGGPVGRRRARTFATEATVVVLSETFASGSFGGAQRIRCHLTPETVGFWLDRLAPALVVAATDDPSVNDAIASAAAQRCLLCNRADRSGTTEPYPGDVAVPSIMRDDPVVVSVSTGATSPALSRALRERIEPTIDGTGELAALLADWRERLSDEPATTRHTALRAVVSSDRVWKALGDTHTKTEHVVSETIEAALGETR